MRLAATLLKLPIHVYRWTLKPLVGHYCRHWPTCSEYGLQAIDTNGAWRGFWLTTSRVIRCGPGGTSGVDPVPDIARTLSCPRALALWTVAGSERRTVTGTDDEHHQDDNAPRW